MSLLLFKFQKSNFRVTCQWSSIRRTNENQYNSFNICIFLSDYLIIAEWAAKLHADEYFHVNAFSTSAARRHFEIFPCMVHGHFFWTTNQFEQKITYTICLMDGRIVSQQRRLHPRHETSIYASSRHKSHCPERARAGAQEPTSKNPHLKWFQVRIECIFDKNADFICLKVQQQQQRHNAINLDLGTMQFTSQTWSKKNKRKHMHGRLDVNFFFCRWEDSSCANLTVAIRCRQQRIFFSTSM